MFQKWSCKRKLKKFIQRNFQNLNSSQLVMRGSLTFCVLWLRIPVTLDEQPPLKFFFNATNVQCKTHPRMASASINVALLYNDPFM